jgi:hypothetical protein
VDASEKAWLEKAWLEKYFQKQLDDCQKHEADRLAEHERAGRERLQDWIDAHDEKHRLEAIALERADEVTDAWKRNANEWRGSLQDDRDDFVRAKTYEVAHGFVLKEQHDQVVEIQALRNKLTSIDSAWKAAFAALGIGMTVLELYLRFGVK